jgi:uncharacterized protein with PIN domain
MDLSFAADRTLGKLSKWLRILGFDTLFGSDASSRWFIEHLQAGRILLTRTEKIRKLFADHRLVFIESNFPIEQLKQVIAECGITAADIRPFSRCIPCNLPVVRVEKDAVYGRVPDYILETNEVFHACPRCERVYWSGSHTKRSMQRIQELFAE